MTAPTPFVQLRQAVIAVADLDGSARELRKELGLAPGFADPLLADIGMDDSSMILGDGASFLELVSPLRADAGVQRWLDKGGPGGYALSIQVSDLGPYLERAEAAGVGVIVDLEVYGHRIVQLHPRDLGLLVELDEIPDRSAWFWDDVEKEIPAAPQVAGFASIELASADPAAQAARWAQVFGVDVDEDPDGPTIALGDLPTRFVAGERAAMTGIGLTRTDGSELTAGSTLALSGVRLDIV